MTVADTQLKVPYKQEFIFPKDHGQRQDISFPDQKTFFQEYLAAGRYPQLSIVWDEADLDPLKTIAADFKHAFESVVILGTGGSSLGAQAICALRYGGLGLPQPQPALYFMDNIDPHTFKDLLTALDLKKTGIIAVSKSGSTAETVFQLLHMIECMKTVLSVEQLKEHIVLLTEPKDSPLMRIGHEYGLRVLDHHREIGGRFSAFSNVAALPALIAGIDFQKVRCGARSVLETLDLPWEGAKAVYHLYTQASIRNTVIMPYLDKLFLFAGWFRQLWAESLGKQGQGLTPIRALGTVDQHSQTQLYLDGPRDKFFTFLFSKPQEIGGLAPSTDPKLAYLRGKTMGDLLEAEQWATAMTLKEKGCPLRILQFESLTEDVMGALMMHYMVETIMTAHLMTIDPFNQPAVERGKELTRSYLQER